MLFSFKQLFYIELTLTTLKSKIDFVECRAFQRS